MWGGMGEERFVLLVQELERLLEVEEMCEGKGWRKCEDWRWELGAYGEVCLVDEIWDEV